MIYCIRFSSKTRVEIILRCLEKVPEMRFRDGSQLAQALETL